MGSMPHAPTSYIKVNRRFFPVGANQRNSIIPSKVCILYQSPAFPSVSRKVFLRPRVLGANGIPFSAQVSKPDHPFDRIDRSAGKKKDRHNATKSKSPFHDRYHDLLSSISHLLFVPARPGKYLKHLFLGWRLQNITRGKFLRLRVTGILNPFGRCFQVVGCMP